MPVLRVLPGGLSETRTSTKTHRTAVAGASSPRFVGREQQCRLVRQLLAGRPGGHGPAVLITGAAGVGKTAMLEHLAITTPARVLWVRGAEPEAVLPFAAAADLLMPLRRYFGRLPDVQREALEVSLGLRGGPVPAPLLTCVATVAVLQAAGAEQRLLVLVDDLHWVDPESRQVLSYAARRLAGGAVAMLLTTREQPGSAVATGLATLRLEGLSLEESAALVASMGIEVPRAVLEKIVRQTGGNPLALVETVRRGRPAVLGGAGLDVSGPRVGPSQRGVWLSALDVLPQRTRTALLVVAASRSSRVTDLEPVLAALGLSAADLDPAERAGLLYSHPSGVRLRSPLAWSAILACTPLATWQEALRALAEHAQTHSERVQTHREPCSPGGTDMAENGPSGLDALTPQELRVAQSVAEGLNNIEVAAALFVSRKTVEAHLTRIYRKLGVRSRTELARLLLRDLPVY